jgi:hypothetical protein
VKTVTSSGDEAVLTGRAPRDLRGLDVDLERVLPDPPLVEFQPRGLEGIRLEHLRAGVDHRHVHALDHIGAVEHKRLVAAAGEPVVVLEAQVEHLERRAHTPVEHDDALARGCQEVAHPE